MKKVFCIVLVLVVGFFSVTHANAWTWYGTYESSPSGYVNSFYNSTIRNINYSASGSNYLYKNQVTTQCAPGSYGLPTTGVNKYIYSTDRGAYIQTISIANVANPSDYVIVNLRYADFDYAPGSGLYQPVSWGDVTVTNGIIETSGTAHLRIRSMVDGMGGDSATYYSYGLFEFRFYIQK